MREALLYICHRDGLRLWLQSSAALDRPSIPLNLLKATTYLSSLWGLRCCGLAGLGMYHPLHLSTTDINNNNHTSPHQIRFNGGSALASNEYAVLAIVNSQIAAAASMVTWLLLDLFVKKSVSVVLNSLSLPR